MTLRIGGLALRTPVVLAPMAGITNAPFRTLCRRFGGGLYVSEMIGARALVEGNEKTLDLIRFAPDETPRSIQLYGTEPDSIEGATRFLTEERGVDHIDLNFGCPVPKITRHGGGAALPWKRRLFGAIVSAAVRGAGDVPVTVKLRMGLDDDHLTYLESGRIAVDSGAAAVALHARTAQQLYSGQAQWEAITALKESIDEVPVLGNGDIWVADDAVRMMEQTGCDGVVIGRGCLGRPWFFAELEAALAGEELPPPPSLGDVCDVLREHAQLLVDWFGPHLGIRHFRKHPNWYLKGYPIGSEIRRRLNQVEDLHEVDELLGTLDPSLPFPDAAKDAKRGHTHGPRSVKLPQGFLDDRDEMPELDLEAGLAVSGG
jgi:nifR3 family TIM-barrel protein